MAIGFEFTVLLTTANANYVHKRTNVLLAICTFLMTLFFFNVFNEVEIISVFRIVFVSVLVAFINYIYAELFVKKWKEYKDSLINKSDLQVQFDNLNEAYWETKLLAIDLENKTKVHEENISLLKNELSKHDIVTQNYEHKLIIEKEKNEILQQEITDLKKRLSRKRESTLEAQ